MIRATFLLIALLAAGSARADDRVPPVNRQQVTLSFAPVVKQVAPAVVNIYTRKVVRTRVNPLFDDPFFRRFFGDDGAAGLSRDQVQNSLGSGVIVRSSGVVITNNHVVGGADEIRVVLADKREFEAKVVGTDERSDLAVLQLQKVTESLPAIELSDSDQVEVGDLVLAVGDPFALGQTVTMGIVSALGRSTIGAGDYRSFIQTDAAINPGNSGGALVTSDGRLIGINTLIYSQSGGNVGIGFAIPSNMVRTVLASILKQGHAVHAWFGATGKTVDADLAKNLGLSRPEGVAITRVTADSPAARAGIRTGDVVRKVNGRAIGDVDELRYVLATLQIGATATLELTRDGADITEHMAIEAPPEVPPRHTTLLKGHQPLEGVTVANLNPALADELGIQFDEPGVIITKISDDSYAARIGVQPGDIVLDVNGETAKTVDDLVRMLAIPVGGWKVTLSRGGRAIQFSVSN